MTQEVLSKVSEDIDVTLKSAGRFARVTQPQLNVEKKKQSLEHQRNSTAIGERLRVEQ